MGLWGIGNMMLIFLAGLQGVPTELYDAAKVDGAGAWTTFRHVTLPMISPVLFYNLIIAWSAFQYFTQAYVLSNGQPGRATLFYNLNLYREAFAFNQLGYASALAWVLFVIVLGLTVAAVPDVAPLGLLRGRTAMTAIAARRPTARRRRPAAPADAAVHGPRRR